MKRSRYHGVCNCAGRRIKIKRNSLGLSQEQLAARMQLNGLDISREGISRVETGMRFLADYELLLFAKVLRVRLCWLLGIDDCGKRSE